MASTPFWAILTTILAITISYVAAQTSCGGRCGAQFYRGYMCQCDYQCLAHQECCKDYETQCTQRHSCKGRCGEVFRRGRRCTCDSECMKFNNCCPDHQTYCDTAADEEAELEKWTSADDPLAPLVAPQENYDDFSNDFYDQNFPNLPDDPISKEDLETISVPKSTSSFEPPQDPIYGDIATISPDTEMAPTFSSENQPTDINATPSPSDQPPTGTTIPETEPITQAQETGATSPPDPPTSTAFSEVSGEPVLSSTAQTGSISTEATTDLQTRLQDGASGSAENEPIEPSIYPSDESEVLPSTAPTEATQPTPGLTVTATSSLDADATVPDTTGVTQGSSSTQPTTASSETTNPTHPSTTTVLTVTATSDLEVNDNVPDSTGDTQGSTSSEPSPITAQPIELTSTPDLTATPTSSLDANTTVVMDTTGITEGSSSSEPNIAASDQTEPTEATEETTTKDLTMTPTSAIDPTVKDEEEEGRVTPDSSSSEPNTDLTMTPTSRVDTSPAVVPETTAATQGSSSSEPNTGSISSIAPTPTSSGPQIDTLSTLPPSAIDPTVKDEEEEGRVTPDSSSSEPNTDLTMTPTSRVDTSPAVVPETTAATQGSSSSEPNTGSISSIAPTPTSSGPQIDTLSTLPPSAIDPTVKDEEEEGRVTPDSSSSEPNTDLTMTPTSRVDTSPAVVPETTAATQGSSSSEPNTGSIATTIPTLLAVSSQDQTPDPEEPVPGKEEDAPTSTASSIPGEGPEASEPQAPETEDTHTTDGPDHLGPQTDTLSTLPPTPPDPTVKDNKEEGGVTSAPTQPATSKPTTTPQSRPTRPAPNRPAPNRPAPTRPAPNRPAPNRPAPTRPAPNRPAPTRPAPNRPTAAANIPSLGKPAPRPNPKPVHTAQVTYQADDSHDMNLCSGRPVGAVTTLRNGTVVVFRGHYFWLLDRNRVPGPARPITQVWGVPSPVDTVFTRCNCQGKTYIFKGSLYWRFDNGLVDPGYPRLIHQGFDGLRGQVTAALSVPQYQRRQESVYFFKRGGSVQKYSYQMGTGSTCGRKPQLAVYTVSRRVARSAGSVLEPAINIRVSWRGFPSSVTSAVSVPSRRVPEGYKYYVFSRSTYYNVQMSARRPVIAVPQVNSPPQQHSANDFFRCP